MLANYNTSKEYSTKIKFFHFVIHKWAGKVIIFDRQIYVNSAAARRVRGPWSVKQIIGNDVVHNVPSGAPVMCSQIISPIESDDIPSSDMLPASAVTRFQTRGKMSVERPDDRLVDPPLNGALVHLDKVKLLEEQVNELLAFLSKIKEGIKNCSDGYSNYRNLTLSSSTSKVLRT